MKQPPHPLDSLAEAEIIKMARDGNREAFGELMIRWELYIKKSLRRSMSHPEDVDDAFQETALALMIPIRNIKHDNFSGWMRLVIKRQRYLFLDRVLTKSNRLKTGENIFDVIIRRITSRDDDPSRACEKLEIQKDVETAINQLPDKQQEAIRGVFLEEKYYREVAEEKKVTQQAIDQRVQVAKKTLRDSLSQHEH